jgi:hypothetical protein
MSSFVLYEARLLSEEKIFKERILTPTAKAKIPENVT